MYSYGSVTFCYCSVVAGVHIFGEILDELNHQLSILWIEQILQDRPIGNSSDDEIANMHAFGELQMYLHEKTHFEAIPSANILLEQENFIAVVPPLDYVLNVDVDGTAYSVHTRDLEQLIAVYYISSLVQTEDLWGSW